MRALLLLLLFTTAAAQDKRFEITISGLKMAGNSGQIADDRMSGEVTGNAKVTLPARSDRTVIRHPGGTLVTPSEVVITAEKISIRDGLLLTARGKVVITTRGERVEAAEFELFLKIGDGEVKGDVRVNGKTSVRTDFRALPRRIPLPPDMRELPAARKQK